jgi:hypothetical protein
MVIKRVPQHLRSDKGPEFVARDLRKWLAGSEAGGLAKTLCNSDHPSTHLNRQKSHQQE